MANFELRFLCDFNNEDYITCKSADDDTISIVICYENTNYDILLDKSTAIKFAKTLRTEINKIES